MNSNINLNDRVESKNIGVFLDNDKVRLCFFDKLGESTLAVALSDFQRVDFSKVVPVNDMFYKQEDTDKGPHGDKLAYIAQNENCPIINALKSDKSIVCLRGLSMLESDIFWYNEDHGVQTVNIDKDKSFRIKDILKIESKVNKLEQKARDKEEVSGIEMQ